MKQNKKELRKAEHRKMEQISRKKKNQKWIITASFILIAIVSVVIVISMSNNIENDIENIEPTTPLDVVSQSEITIPVSDINTNAKFYNYKSDGINIRYFTAIGSDGEIHVALDACDVCYGAKKGYTQVNDVMQCINCGLTFPINDLGVSNSGGGCWPSYIPIKIDGDNVIIEISDLEDKSYMFR